MKKITYILSALLLAFSFTGCEDMLYDNKNPDTSPMVTAPQSLPVVLFYGAQTNYDHAEYGMYLSQAYTTGGRSQTGSLAYKSGWEFLTMNRHPQWRRHYYDIGVNVNTLIEAAEDIRSYNFILIARTIRLLSTQLTTDAFGDMPLKEAYTKSAPAYDTQEEIYEWMLNEVEELLALYNDPAYADAPTNTEITQSMDRIFAGDLKKWRQFTYALKARILLRKLPNWDNNQAACRAIIEAVDNAYTADWEEPLYRFDGGIGEANCPWGPAQPNINAWESRKNELDKAIITKFFCVDMMGIYDRASVSAGYAEDPRMEALMQARAGATGSSSYRYLESNIGLAVSAKESHYPDLYNSGITGVKNPYTQNDGYLPLFLTEELLLIKAEALYWMNNKFDARNLTMEAALMNMERLQAKQNYINRYMAMDKYFPEIDFNIGHIMRQKYVCMYLQPEMWNDMRRYNYSNSNNKITYDGATIYPGLRRPYNLYEPYWMVNKNADGSIKEEWVQRLNYDPETEEKYNRPELERLGAYKSSEWLKKPMIWAIYNESVK